MHPFFHSLVKIVSYCTSVERKTDCNRYCFNPYISLRRPWGSKPMLPFVLAVILDSVWMSPLYSESRRAYNWWAGGHFGAYRVFGHGDTSVTVWGTWRLVCPTGGGKAGVLHRQIYAVKGWLLHPCQQCGERCAQGKASVDAYLCRLQRSAAI